MARTKIVGGGSKKRYRSRSTSASSQDSFSSGSYSGKIYEIASFIYFTSFIESKLDQNIHNDTISISQEAAQKKMMSVPEKTYRKTRKVLVIFVYGELHR